MASEQSARTSGGAAAAAPGGGEAAAPMELEVEADGASTSTCSHCNREVPPANLVLHEAACGRARAASQQQQASQQPSQPSDERQPRPRIEHPLQVQEQAEESPSETEPLLSSSRERGQQTLDGWLSNASSSSSNNSITGSRNYSSATSTSGSNSTSTEAEGHATTDGGAGASASGVSVSSTSTSADYTATTHNINILESSDSDSAAVGTASFVGNIRPPGRQSTAIAQTGGSQSSGVATAAAATGDGNVHVGENQWQCPRCTLINENSNRNCDACLAPRNRTSRSPDSTTSDRLMQEENNGWVNVTYNPQFQRGRDGGIARTRVPRDRFSVRVQNPLVHGGRFGTVTRVLNGLLNGAIVGSVFAGPGGMIFGGLAGAAGGALVDRTRNREEANEMRETREVANMLMNDDGGVEAGTVRVHRSDGHITALASDNAGRNRVIRVRYDRPRTSDLRQYPGNAPRRNSENAELRRRVDGAREDLERSLLEILVQMSYSRDFGPGPGDNVILQPEESFEELTRRFGLGTENRGASSAVIDSYPVHLVGQDDDGSSDSESGSDSDDSSSHMSTEEGKRAEDDDYGEESSHTSMDTDGTSEFGTCGICLEDYKEGESVKELSCPHHFHTECIDKWLRLVVTCPICKNKVGMYKAPRVEGNIGAATMTGTRTVTG